MNTEEKITIVKNILHNLITNKTVVSVRTNNGSIDFYCDCGNQRSVILGTSYGSEKYWLRIDLKNPLTGLVFLLLRPNFYAVGLSNLKVNKGQEIKEDTLQLATVYIKIEELENCILKIKNESNFSIKFNEFTIICGNPN